MLRSLQVKVGLAALGTALGASMLAGPANAAGGLVGAAGVPAPRSVDVGRGMMSLAGDVPLALRTARDQGKLRDAMPIPYVMMALKRPPAAQAALDALTREQQTRGSAQFHKWLRPADLAKFGPSQAEIAKVVNWLGREGLTVNRVSASGMTIEFAGTAGRIGSAFHTELHNVLRNGEAHVSNVSAPVVPAEFSNVVAGVSLANFYPKPMFTKPTPTFTVPSPYGTYYAVAPADFATIYNINPLRSGSNAYGTPITGTGITLAMVEQTTIQPADWAEFRRIFKLSSYPGTLSQIHPGNCGAPSTTGDEGEAALDTEWSSAVAPAATILEASCLGKAPYGFGVMITLQNLVENPTPATVFSVSYGGDEYYDGTAFETAWTNLVEEGASEGKSIFVSSGDSGVSAQEGGIDQYGLFVNGLADTAYNVSVGGTDFYDTALGQNAKYWSAANGSGKESALSYVPEIPWNNSCASEIISTYLGYTDPGTFCNASQNEPVQNDVGGSGSQSIFYPKPYWQLTSQLGETNDGVRDQPDVALFAANGIWNHFYVFCMSDENEGGSPCSYGSYNQVFGNAAGGTSFAAPAFAGIMALIQQSQSGSTGLGNPAPALYQEAASQYATSSNRSGCTSDLGNAIGAGCVFNYVVDGDNSEPCAAGSPSCITGASDALGIGRLGMGNSDGITTFDYHARRGYNEATGLGTVNVTNLLYNYPGSAP